MVFWLLFIPSLVFIALVFLIASGIKFGQRAIFETFQEVSKRLKGTHSAQGYKNLVYFRSGEVRFVLQGRSTKGKPVVQVYAAWPDASFRGKLFPETLSDEMKKFLGMQDIKIGVERFDRRFVIQSNDEHRMIEFLVPHVQTAILAFGPRAVLNISGGKIQLDYPMPLRDADRINSLVKRFVEAYFVMLDSMVNSDVSIEVTAVSLESAASMCMICGEEVSERKVQCKTCQTPHHKECWEYLGQCSTYGCGQKKFKSKLTPFHIIE